MAANNSAATVTVVADLALEPASAFSTLMEELSLRLADMGITFTVGPGGGVEAGGAQVGRVVAWEPGSRVVLEWRAADWHEDDRSSSSVEIDCEAQDGGTRVTFEHTGWGRPIADHTEIAAWISSEVLAPIVRATTPQALGDWITDRGARRPAGSRARSIYADPLYHYPNFRVILLELGLTPNDYLLEVGCGGGAFLKEALRSGCRAGAVDHSPDMVRLASEVNRASIDTGVLQIVPARAERLPFSDGTFTCAAMTGVLGFLPDPVAAFAEIRRVLQAGGRFVCLGSDPELLGTPAAPEPFASRLIFYDDAGLERIAHEAGFAAVKVVRRNLEAYAREAGVPEEHLFLFGGTGGRFLLARAAEQLTGT